MQRGIGERHRALRFADSEQNIGIGNEEENLIRVHQIGHQGVTADGNRRAAIAGNTVRSRRGSYGIGGPAVVLVVGQRKSAAAVGGEQTGDGFGHAWSAAAQGESGEENHQVAVQRGVGETSGGNLLLHHNAVEQRSRRRNRVALHHKKFSGIHDVENEIEARGHSAKREGEIHGAAAGGGIGNRVIRGGKSHRIIRAVTVEVSRGVGERACPV